MKYHVYTSIAGENKISTFKMNPDTGKLLFQGDIALSGGPGPLAVDPRRRFLYAGIRTTCQISSFRIDHSTGGLSLIGTISLDSDPCYITTDRRGNFLLSAYYRAGKVAVHSIDENGAAGSPAVEWLSTVEHAHCIQTDASNKFAFVPHTVESNCIFQFKFDENTGKLTPNDIPKVIPEEKVGPRHFCFHPGKDIIYVSNEQGSSVTAYNFDQSAGTLTAFQTISTLPEDCDKENTCAQIHITPSGKFLYVSNRGHDSIAGFSIDDATGQLASLGQQPTEPTPRAFTIDPTGNFLFAGGQGSGNLASYRINLKTGELKPLETYVVGKNPMWVLVVNLTVALLNKL
jgi:6-phosphogluconolactonase